MQTAERKLNKQFHVLSDTLPNGYHVHIFDDIESLYEKSKDPAAPKCKDSYARSVGSFAKDGTPSFTCTSWKEGSPRMKDWLGVSSYKEWEERLSGGWSEGYEKALAKRDAILQVSRMRQGKKPRRRRVQAEFGNEVDMSRIYAGNTAKAWQSTRKDTRRGMIKHVTLCVDLCATWNTSAESIYWRGATALAIADQLERSGRRVRIVGYCPSDYLYNEGEKKHSMVAVKVKDFHQLMDGNSLAAILCTAATFRYNIWSLWHQINQGPNDGLGRVPELWPHAIPFARKGDYKISKVWNEKDSADIYDKILADLAGAEGGDDNGYQKGK